MKLVVSEVFGPTVQGEGPSTGRRCIFLRLGLCNLDCSWCDTPYTWDWTGKNGPPQDRSALDRTAATEVADRLLAYEERMLVVSGGEPVVQQSGLVELLTELGGAMRVEVETNGTLVPHHELCELVDHWNVSPKLPHSGVDIRRAWHEQALRAYAEQPSVAFKVVCVTTDDVALTAQLTAAAGIDPGLVWIMPEGRSADAVEQRTAELAEAAIGHGFNLTTRLHVIVWGDKRGV